MEPVRVHESGSLVPETVRDAVDGPKEVAVQLAAHAGARVAVQP